MTEVPSFLYSGFDSETYELSRELRALGGGGDAKTINLSLNAVIIPPTLQYSSQSQRDISGILSHSDSSVGLRDILSPPQSPAAESMRNFYVTNVVDTDMAARVEQEVKQTVADIFEGFNRCCISYGERIAGKTKFFFSTGGFVDVLLSSIYNRKSHADTVAVSSWIIQGNNVIE